jgi:3',5'-cyclic AMP phosphodiesterase CpdA
MAKITRREALARMGALMAMGGLGVRSATAQTTTGSAINAGTASTAALDKSFSFAHITDVHIYEKNSSEYWVSQCLKKIQEHAAKPQLIVNTGDSIMDSIRQDRETSEKYWKIWNTTLQRENSLPLYNVLGNHDMWGIRMDKGHPVYEDPMFGKKLGQERIGMEKLYYSFDHGNWHFVMLDSVSPFRTEEGGDWVGKLDEEQFEWLKQDLKNTPADRYVVVGSHIPILQVTSMGNIEPNERGAYEIGPKGMMTDARQIIDLFRKHPNVKLCLSGHTHGNDRVTLKDTTYINAGSVCGGKWRLDQNGDRMGYSIVTLHPDGKFDYAYENYGWEPRA